MVGFKLEYVGIIKDGVKMVNVMVNFVVLKFFVVIGNLYGVGNYVMCGKVYDLCLIVGWLIVEIVVMLGVVVVKIFLQIEVVLLKVKGEEIMFECEQELFNMIKLRYDEQILLYYVVLCLWIDVIIDLVKICSVFLQGIVMVSYKKVEKVYNVGVI